MIVVHTSIPFDPNRYEEAIELVKTLVERSRQEPGTVRYRAMTDIIDEYTIRFFEQYEDEAALTAHTQTEHYRRFTDRLPDLVDGSMETVRFEDIDDPDVHQFTTDDLS